jgi:hypothetical protein
MKRIFEEFEDNLFNNKEKVRGMLLFGVCDMWTDRFVCFRLDRILQSSRSYHVDLSDGFCFVGWCE